LVLTHTGDGHPIVPGKNSIRFYQELIRHGVPQEMHLYPKGNHGFCFKFPTGMMRALFSWMGEKSGLNTLFSPQLNRQT